MDSGLQDVDEDDVADVEFRLGLGIASVELAVADDTLGLGADVDEHLVLVDAHDGALDHVAVLETGDIARLLREQLLHGGGLRASICDRRLFGHRGLGDLRGGRLGSRFSSRVRGCDCLRGLGDLRGGRLGSRFSSHVRGCDCLRGLGDLRGGRLGSRFSSRVRGCDCLRGLDSGRGRYGRHVVGACLLCRGRFSGRGGVRARGSLRLDDGSRVTRCQRGFGRGLDRCLLRGCGLGGCGRCLGLGPGVVRVARGALGVGDLRLF